MTTIVLVPGTWGGQWADGASPFRLMLRAHEIRPTRFDGWTENVDGVPNILEHGAHRDWIAGGAALGYFLRALPLDDRNLICHSHAVNVALYELAQAKVPIRNLLTICSPVRDDMQATADAAVPHILGRWRHVASTDWDLWQRLGELADGGWHWRQVRRWKQANENTLIPHIGHSKLLNKPALFPLWDSERLIDALCAPIAAPLGAA